MADQYPAELSEALTRVRTRLARVRALEHELEDAKKGLRAEVVAARRSGELVADIQKAAEWSAQTINVVLREGGIEPDRSAPRKRRTTP